MDETTTQRRQADRRRLWDRRAPLARRSSVDRRLADRRSSAQTAPEERRENSDRRSTDRRVSVVEDRRSGVPRRRRERRRSTPVPFTPAQLAELRQRFSAPGIVTCPACGGRFTLGPMTRPGGGPMERLVLCLGCGRGTVVEDAAAARVLVISAMTPLRGLLRDMLLGAGHEVIEAADAAVGLDAYRTVPADVVIVDVIGAGRMDAPEFIRRLREAFPDARVVALAGRSSYAGVDPLSLVEGLQDVRGLRVPVSREALLETVRELRA